MLVTNEVGKKLPENVWLLLARHSALRMQGKGYRWVDNQVFRLGCQQVNKVNKVRSLPL